MTPGRTYTVTVSDFTSYFHHNFDLFVFQGDSFTGPPAATSATKNDPESCAIAATSGTLSVRVDDRSGTGGVLKLKVE